MPALASSGTHLALCAALLGDEALHMWPFAAGRPRDNISGADRRRLQVAFAQRFDHSPCRLCGGGGGGHESVNTVYL